MNVSQIASIILIVGSLILVTLGMRGRQMAPGRRVQMAVAWLVIIVGVVWLIQMSGFEIAR